MPERGPSKRVDWLSWVRRAAGVALLLSFVHWFHPAKRQDLIDLLWIGALGVWVWEVRSWNRGPLMSARPRRADIALITGIIGVFCIAWLPFYDNWRWAYTGDSIVWYAFAESVARNGRVTSLLSLQGVDGNFTFLHSVTFNGLMFVFEPSLFWHRVGKLIVSSLSLVAIYAYFTCVLGRWMAAAVVIGTAVNYVWLWFSYVSYGHIDSHVFYFLTLLYATLVWRRPDDLGPWLICGLVGGGSLYFTQTAWSAVAAVGVFLGALALTTRHLKGAIVYGVTFFLLATPVGLQWRTLLEMTTRQAKSVFDWTYLREIFTAIMWLPYDSGIHNIGVEGAFLRAPLGTLYVAGCVVALLGVLPPVRRAMRVPAVAPVLLGLVLWDAALMTLTNNSYSGPSTKRCYNLIPLQVFLALLPSYVLYAVGARWRWWRSGAVLVSAGVLCAYGVANLWIISFPEAGTYGSNVFDGLVELRQRFPERQVRLLGSRPEHGGAVAGRFLDRAYHVADTVRLSVDFSASFVERTCREGSLLCVEPNYDRARLEPIFGAYGHILEPFPLLNSRELRCYECRLNSGHLPPS